VATTAEHPREQTRVDKPVYKKWWLWTIVGGVAVGAALGVGLGLGLSNGPQFDADLGTVGPGAALTVGY
jgi:hypothetical protein